MSFQNEQTLYDLLDLKPDASPQEIREAYLKAKAAYTKDSLALYTLISGDERELMLKEVERAYQILSNPDKRREYDKNHSSLDALENLLINTEAKATASKTKNVVSIDRVPPMESETSESLEKLLVPPVTDTKVVAPPSENTFVQEPTNKLATQSPPAFHTQTDWSGADLKRVREARRLSLEELSSFTKISKTYISAVEDELFSKLPAPVFVRGFITQIAKALKLPADQVAISYMTRYKSSSK